MAEEATVQVDKPAAPAEATGRVAREVAQRLFAAEFNASKLEVRETGERAPAYLVSPLGARVNRLLVVGVLTSNETVGQTGEMWRAQVTDPTGVFSVFAGQYQPEAARALSELKPPVIVAVVGKSRVYSPEPGVIYTSIRPESITIVDVADRDQWIAETARFTLERIDCVREATVLTPPTVAALKDLGYREDLADGAVRALAHYGPADVPKWAATLRDAVEFLTPSGETRRKQV
ncbi:MAG TPA: hypothetical protein VI997_11035, partial [Candidatus Thermoplasmatota archaeon]|nr:hypothetical protein [Candidatus Thermoplasmatota archaeon]